MRTSLAFACLLFIVTLSQFTASTFSFSSEQQPALLCHSDERLALMQFKESFINNSESGLCGFPRWDFQGVDCCSWDGIECNHITGHVIGLDLSNSCLYGSIKSSSTLFRLVHLKNLNLAINNFNYSLIPSAFANLSMLTYLNLSDSRFSGQIPSELSKLYRLSSLDLSRNGVTDPKFERFLVLKNPDLKSFIKNLTNLSNLNLGWVDVAASPVPSVLANFSSLTTLNLERCGLKGMFPLPIFKLPKLETIWLVNNRDVTGYFPEFNYSNKLKVIALLGTSFSGELPASIGNLGSLELLGLGQCNFSGSVPSTLGYLPNLKLLDLAYNSFTGSVPSTLGNLIMLENLSLHSNHFTGLVPSTLGYLPNLKFLDLAHNSFTGSVPSTLGNLTKLDNLDLQSNNFTGFIPPELTNLTQLTKFNVLNNMLQGPVPSSISRLKKLQLFDCDDNSLSGVLDMDSFLELKDLQYLFLSLNDFHLLSRNNFSNSTTSPQLVDIGLRSCHIREFPNFLRNQHQLELLDLSLNNIQGQIPQWMSKVSVERLLFLDLANNSLTGFDESFPVVLPWSKLKFLRLESNTLQGSLPVPPLSTIYYFISNNALSGEIPHQLCNLTSLSILDFSHNNLSGEIPMCLSNFSKSLLVLKAGSNNFDGPVPDSWGTGNQLKMIDLSKNRLQGNIPKSLMECKMLEYLDLGNNQISDAFPSWLGTLLELKVLILSSNSLYGVIGDPNKYSNDSVIFPKLRIIDLSCNKFNGTLPSDYFDRWIAMTSLDGAKNSSAVYMQEHINMNINVMAVPRVYSYSMTFTNKGRRMLYPKIIETLVAIDFSGNRFEGEIPESIGNMKELQFLNLSNNNLVGEIPIAIAKLTNLEALDLSQNKLQGRIPFELSAELTFLSFLNVSDNYLAGLIPQGNQFETFQRSSFDGNLELCGKPLLNECHARSGSFPPPSSTSSESEEFDLDWKVVLLGYGCGFIFGMVLGNVVYKRKGDWLAKVTFSKSNGRRQTR